jgi:hypothetical protein
MAKSSWKFYNFNVKDIYHFLQEYRLPTKYQELQYYGFVSNEFKLNTINYMHSYKFYQGNNYVVKKFSIYNIGNKGKEFLKFTKPFNFRSKKKKNNC